MMFIPMNIYTNKTMETVRPFLTVKDLHITFAVENGGLQALQGVNFQVAPQEFVCVIGPSGSGKSTLLRVIAGVLQPSHGEVNFSYDGDREVKIGYVFQQANLMPWRTVIENITLPLELHQVPAEETRSKAMDLIELVGLKGFEQTWVQELSGGMAQRVAIARALIQDPDLLLLDEPFGALDALMREQMGAELLRIWQARRTTVLMVTHSISEALLLSDRVLVLSARPGRISCDFPVNLSRPRQEDLRYTPEFAHMSQQLRAEILPD
ncbi:MAG: ABC transporter ATP-binding protein [Anaerolineaceae bacterium]|nr:ABC transporter ATP-binding protein [Anaerolineaceae bacterium]